MATANQKKRALEKACEIIKAHAQSGRQGFGAQQLEDFYRKLIELAEDADKDD